MKKIFIILTVLLGLLFPFTSVLADEGAIEEPTEEQRASQTNETDGLTLTLADYEDDHVDNYVRYKITVSAGTFQFDSNNKAVNKTFTTVLTVIGSHNGWISLSSYSYTKYGAYLRAVFNVSGYVGSQSLSYNITYDIPYYPVI